MDAAFGRMRAYSRARNRRLGDVAAQIITNEMDAAELENVSRALAAED
jgi:AmiR/NasT family two-component response regulator